MKRSALILGMIQGQIGKKFVVKHYGKKVVVTKAPDMSNIIPSAAQLACRGRFSAAVAWAKNINRTPALRAAYVQQARGSKSVYQWLVKAWLNNNGPVEPEQ